MGWAGGWALGAAVTLSAFPASAQDRSDFEHGPPFRIEDNCLPKATAARGILLGDAPFAVLTESGALTQDCTVISMHNATRLVKKEKGKRPEPLYFIRRETTPYTGPTTVDYADSRSCPTLLDALHALETFKPSGIYLSELHPTDEITITTDGAYYGLWSNVSGDKGDLDGFELNAGGWNYPGLSKTFGSVTSALATCWSNKPPQRP